MPAGCNQKGADDDDDGAGSSPAQIRTIDGNQAKVDVCGIQRD
ncbi:hypothetical protein O5254_27800, partial [Escherichia coli]|nr:hypothetical protein [Escherichia coli]